MTGIENYTYKPVAGTEDFDLVVEVGESGGYSWDTLLGFYSPSKRRYFWVEGSGCSCNDISMQMGSPDTFSNGDRDALERAVKSWHDNAYERRTSPDARAADIASVKNYREDV